ncbi:MAG: glycosyl hydrolase [Alphaproteobacteria bacterium]|nr:glycosyl hydrolase [Alphaproteobacteria bacterium]
MTSAPSKGALDQLHGLRWRCIGPTRGGRVVAVAGDPADPMAFYFGACAGGVWKTVDGGLYWRCVSDGYFTSAAIGAIAVAASDANVIYAGTGETTIRIDVSYGDGIYKSTDAGRSWSHIGLRETRHIGKIVIHPQNPDLVYVAALGDAFGSNPERGLYRSSDGGKSWTCVLHQGPDAGAVDVAMDLNNPRILFASTWRARRSFWNLTSGGPGSGLHRSFDGGDTWEVLGESHGFPSGMLGKIGVAVSAARPGRVWAIVEAEGDKIGLWRSDDYGDRWTQVCRSRDLITRPWYYCHVFADPGHGDTVYITNLQMWKSTDGGVSFGEITTPHGDNHDLWIDPNNPRRMIEGNDGGACVSFNGGASWSSIYNQPTAQFYRLDVDNVHPYRVYGTQQDNTSIAVPSATEWGQISLGDCFYPGTGESGFVAVKPSDPDVVYIGSVGSSPGGAGALQRYDHRTRQIQLVNVWPETSRGIAPRDLKYRFAWTYPIVFSPHEPDTLYVGGNRVFRSRDEGMSWQAISPDISRNEKDKQESSGGPITRDSAGAETYATASAIQESPHRKGEIWVTSDDGRVHKTVDAGVAWTDVTPPDMPDHAYIGSVEISRHDADTVYLAATRYKLADYRPYLFQTANGGRSWTAIDGDLPGTEITRVCRADPVRAGLLYIGTETGIHFSIDDGATWRRMNGGLPVVPVYDLKVQGEDLVAATHGRSFWILDDVTPLRRMSAAVTTATLFPPRSTIRQKLSWSAGRYDKAGISYSPAFGIDGSSELRRERDGTTSRRGLDVGDNPPNGAIVYYWLPDGVAGPVSLTIFDAAGATVIRLASDDTKLAEAKRPPAKPGLNRYVWDLKWPGPTKLDPALAPEKPKALAPESPQSGPAAKPGIYQVVLKAADATLKESFEIRLDPRLKPAPGAVDAQFALLRSLADDLDRVNGAVNRIRLTKRRLADIGGRPGGETLKPRIDALSDRLSTIEQALVDVHRESPRDGLRNPAGLDDGFADLIALAAIADAAPTAQAKAVAVEFKSKLDSLLADLDGLTVQEPAAIDAAAREAGIRLV